MSVCPYVHLHGTTWLPMDGVSRNLISESFSNYNLEELQINSMYLQQVLAYKYLGSTVNSDNSIEEEI